MQHQTLKVIVEGGMCSRWGKTRSNDRGERCIVMEFCLISGISFDAQDELDFGFVFASVSLNNKMGQVLGVVQKELFTVPWWHALNVNRRYLARFTAGISLLLLFELLSKNESYCQIWWTATVSRDKFGHNSAFTAGHHCNDNAKEINLWPWLNECKHKETSTKVPSARTRISH